jgi:hypothetical protein
MVITRALILVWVLLSPQAMGALSQIAQAEILSGSMDLDGPMTGRIYAVGKKDGKVWDIELAWSNGYPKGKIYFLRPRSEL